MIKSKPGIQPSITEEIQNLRALTVTELVARYEVEFGKPPRVKHREHLWRRIAWKIQERRFGGLSIVAKARLEELIADLDLPIGRKQIVLGSVAGKGSAAEPTVGTTLCRTWKGREILVTAVGEGWEHEGVVYGSLTAVAKGVTGAHRSGPAWFGLTKRTCAR